MLSKEDTQRKRRNDSASSESNEAFEKKQRVEQLIGALSRPGKKCLSNSSVDSTTADIKIEEVKQFLYLLGLFR